MIARLKHTAAGGNRHPSAADWAPGLLAFGAGNNVALWNPNDETYRGIFALLAGHTDVVNAVKILDLNGRRCIITGSGDKTIRLWAPAAENKRFEEVQCLTEHQSSINTITTLFKRPIFTSGSADGTIKIWQLSNSEAKLIQSVSLKPRYLPLASSLIQLFDGSIVLTVAGTSSSIQIYVQDQSSEKFELQATLSGHEGWIRSLDFVKESEDDDADILLASASQDKYIRLWRFQHDKHIGTHPVDTGTDTTSAIGKKSLANKLQQVGSPDNKCSVSFEALLIGHEDWIYTVRWAPRTTVQSALKLLSVSADNSIAIWQADRSSGVWVCETRLGEISGQKGSTTATGSAGGFWIGLWSPDATEATSLGRTGSWRRWKHDSTSDTWEQQLGVSGHTQEVQSLAWANDGSYLLSTGSDQTTRLFAQWKRDGSRSWHEFARPQIHGYDLNCIDTISPDQIISGADEKLLRVFNKPRAIAKLLTTLSGAEGSVNGDLPDAANIPVLGLSNKAITAAADDEPVNGTITNGVDEAEAIDPASIVHKSTLQLAHPPFEEHLSRHTLWPEHEKLYGHGYEISAVAARHDGSMVATACKASSLDHAVIRIYECKEWREVKPPLKAHTLTVTSLSFSPDDRYLLSVGRDRQWAIFERHSSNLQTYRMLISDPRGHARMILDCSWAPAEAVLAFATAGRDKAVKIWRLLESKVECVATVTAGAAVTAVAFAPPNSAETARLAYGTEKGGIHIVDLSDDLQVTNQRAIEKRLSPSKAVNALRWRPRVENDAMSNGSSDAGPHLLAVASDDCSVRILEVDP